MTATAEILVDVERDATSRQRSLATSVRTLRTRAGGTDGAKPLLLIGGILVPLGFIFIILGWAGASRTVNDYEQLPYAISGGMLGLAMVFAGGFTYFAYWLTQLVYAARRDAADTRVVLERIEVLLASGASVAIATGGAGTTASRSAAAAGEATFLATPTGTMFHRPDCPAVAGRDGLRKVTGHEDGLSPCKICEPVAT
jgi:hypothetical protein